MKGQLIFRYEDNGDTTLIKTDHLGNTVAEQRLTDRETKPDPKVVGDAKVSVRKPTSWLGIFMGFGLTIAMIVFIGVTQAWPVYAVIGGMWFGWNMPRYIQRFIDR